MGGLFPRVFISFWLAILSFAVAAAAVTMINFRAENSDPRAIMRQAAVVLQEKGRAGLASWLAARNARYPKQRTLVIDQSGREILGQRLPRRMSGILPPPGRMPPPGDMRGPPGSRIFADDGSVYVVFFDPPPRRGPFSPPFSPQAQLGLLAIAILISGAVSYLLARSISRPLVRLQATARTLAAGQLEERTPADVAARGDELGSLAREFDSMAERLAALIAARQQLLRDLSHELRSPLARLQMAVGLARQAGCGPAAQIERIERESGRLEVMIAEILEYARLERDPSTLRLEEVDLVALAEQVAHDSQYESQSGPDRIRIHCQPEGHPAAFRLRADPQVLHAVLDNVVRNALRHGGDGAVEVLLAATSGEVRAVVRDHGPGVPAEDLQRIFEPFYRVSHQRPGPGVRGSGIGLAVASKATQLHGGRIVAENADGGGLRVTISLPRA